jgi:hypothetical protein
LFVVLLDDVVYNLLTVLGFNGGNVVLFISDKYKSLLPPPPPIIVFFFWSELIQI